MCELCFVKGASEMAEGLQWATLQVPPWMLSKLNAISFIIASSIWTLEDCLDVVSFCVSVDCCTMGSRQWWRIGRVQGRVQWRQQKDFSCTRSRHKQINKAFCGLPVLLQSIGLSFLSPRSSNFEILRLFTTVALLPGSRMHVDEDRKYCCKPQLKSDFYSL